MELSATKRNEGECDAAPLTPPPSTTPHRPPLSSLVLTGPLPAHDSICPNPILPLALLLSGAASLPTSMRPPPHRAHHHLVGLGLRFLGVNGSQQQNDSRAGGEVPDRGTSPRRGIRGGPMLNDDVFPSTG